MGDQQIAQAFVWRASEFANDNGTVALLLPSKSALHNKSAPNRAFRTAFFDKFRVRLIVELSVFRREHFANAVAPMVAVVFEVQRADEVTEDYEIVYCAPRPSQLSARCLIISGEEIHRFHKSRILGQPSIWKTALWGTPRDLRLIDFLRSKFPSLGDTLKHRGWSYGEGVIVAGSSGAMPTHYKDMWFVPTKSVTRYRIKSPKASRIESTGLHRPRESALFQGQDHWNCCGCFLRS